MASSRQVFVFTAVVAATCLVVQIGIAAQVAPPPAAAEKVPLSDEVFKSVQILKGIPVDTFFEAMGMFASSMGNDCTFCHVKEAYFDKTAFAQVTPRMQRARQMLISVCRARCMRGVTWANAVFSKYASLT